MFDPMVYILMAYRIRGENEDNSKATRKLFMNKQHWTLTLTKEIWSVLIKRQADSYLYLCT